MSTVERDVEVSIDEDGNAAVAKVVERTELRLEGLFQNGELRLWQDSAGWSGFLREEADDGNVVYHSVNRLEDGSSEEWIRKVRCGEKAVRDGIQKHIKDPKAGEAGQFVRRCSPP